VERAIFLDRDNTLIHNDADLGDPSKVQLIDGVAPGLRALREAGYRLIVVTNQGGVARGRFTEEDVDTVHQRIAATVDDAAGMPNIIDRFYYCPYHPDAVLDAYRRDHPWRKPNPGMLLQASQDLNIDLSASWMVGDQARDVSAGRKAGCRTLLINEDDQVVQEAHPTKAAASFAAAVQHILEAPAPPPTNNHAPATSQPQTTVPAKPDRLAEADDPTAALHRALMELSEEIRSERQRRTDFTALRMAAVFAELLVVLLALLGLMQLNTDAFMKWMIGAALVQLVVIALLLLDLKG
jgi:D-glycero-D-manno-heptose 1,7-bisphosphate phosphatase